MTVRAITFDLWQTLLQDAHGAGRQAQRLAAFREATGLDDETLTAALHEAWREFDRTHRQEKCTLNGMDAVRLTLDAVGVTLAPAEMEHLADAVANAILDHPPVPIDGALQAVQAAGARCPVGLICDTGASPGDSMRQLLVRYGFADHLPVMTFSNEVGVSKPQAEMFACTSDALGVWPDELLHIGDLEYTDIAGAHNVGAQAALFAGVNDTFKETTAADYVFTHWNQFIEQLPDLLG